MNINYEHNEQHLYTLPKNNKFLLRIILFKDSCYDFVCPWRKLLPSSPTKPYHEISFNKANFPVGIISKGKMRKRSGGAGTPSEKAILFLNKPHQTKSHIYVSLIHRCEVVSRIDDTIQFENQWQTIFIINRLWPLRASVILKECLAKISILA